MGPLANWAELTHDLVVREEEEAPLAKHEEEDDGEVCATCNSEKAIHFGMCAGCGEAVRSALAEIKAAKCKAAKEKAAKEEAKEKEKAAKVKKRKATPGLGGGTKKPRPEGADGEEDSADA